MSNIIFVFNEKETKIECDSQELLKEICKRFTSKEGLDINNLSFFYNKKKLNEELTFGQLVNNNKKQNNSVIIIVKEINEITNNIIIENNNENNLSKSKIISCSYKSKINYIFKKNPNLKYKMDIVNNNSIYGNNHKFEIFISYKDNTEYLVSSNEKYDLEIIQLLNNKKVHTLKGHSIYIMTIRYFINNNDNNEYLISADRLGLVFIWDVTNNYKIKFKIDTSYKTPIYSCLLAFINIQDNYIITSSSGISDDNNSATKIYSLIDGNYIRSFNITKSYDIRYLLLWNDKKDNKYYIINLANKSVIIINIFENEVFCKLSHEKESYHLSGFLYNQNDTDYLCCSSANGLINIWDLNKKKIYKIIDISNSYLMHIIQWNQKYIIAADFDNKSFKIIDFEKGQVVKDIKGEHTDKVPCIKKIYHPLYGESLLTSGQDNTIKLWSL